MEVRTTKDGFSFYSTAEEVTEGIDASNKTVLITGATSGIGAETARVLAMRGACMVLAVRNVDAGEHVKKTILKETPNARLYVLHLDLNSMASIRTFCDNFKSLKLPLNILINNAAVLKTQFELSEDGYESHFAINHLGHFLLTNLLLEDMKRVAKETCTRGKIINVSSIGHKLYPKPEGFQFDKVQDKSKFKNWEAYGNSKLANVLHAKELARRFEEDHVDLVANSLHPGTITDTLIFRDVDKSIVQEKLNHHQVSLKTISQGAATTCFVALHPSAEMCSGQYFEDCEEGVQSDMCKNDGLAKDLWDLSTKATSNIPC